MTTVPQVEANTPAAHHNRAGPDSGTRKPPKTPPEKQELQTKTTRARIGLGVGIASLFGLGYFLKDGLKSGFKNIAGFSKLICSFIAIPAALLFPTTLLISEFNFLKGKNKSNDENKLAKFVNPQVSISFASVTLSEPLEKATQSNLHMIASLFNLPHIIFTFFSFTGGRFMTLLKAVELLISPDKKTRLRLEQEADGFHHIGNIGSDHAGITPLAHFFATGCHLFKALFKRDFSKIKDYFVKNPISFLLSIPSVISFIPDYIGKTLDTTFRTAEGVNQIQNAFSSSKQKGKDPPFLIKILKSIKDFWDKRSGEDSFIGKFLRYGRNFARFDKLVFAPLSMMAVVCPLLNNVFRLNIFNKQAREVGGFAKLADTILSPIAAIGHLYFTGLYGLTIRSPQIVTTATFYLSHAINRYRGAKPGDPNFIEPNKIRDRLFNFKFIHKISDWASNILDKIEIEMHPDDPKLIKTRTYTRIKVDENGKACIDEKGRPIEEKVTVKGRGRSRYVQSYAEIMAEQEAYIPAREELFKELNASGLSDKERGKILEENKEKIISRAKEIFRQHLINVDHFTDEDLSDFFIRYKRYDEINKEVINLIEKEIKACKTEEDFTSESRKFKLKANDFFEMLFHPIKYWEDIKQVFSLRTFVAKFVILPLHILGFVNGAEFGKENEPYKLRKHIAESQIIKVLDNIIAIESEMPPVWMEINRNAVEGFKNITKIFGALSGKGSFALVDESAEDQYPLAA